MFKTMICTCSVLDDFGSLKIIVFYFMFSGVLGYIITASEEIFL